MQRLPASSNDQISGDNEAHKKKQIQWTEKCQDTFNMLKVMCTSAPVLAFSDFMKSFRLHTDASTIGLGAILYQEQGGKDQVIGYTSKALSKSECFYLTHKLEFLPLKLAIRESF